MKNIWSNGVLETNQIYSSLEFEVEEVSFSSFSNHGFLKIKLPYQYSKIEGKVKKGDKVHVILDREDWPKKFEQAMENIFYRIQMSDGYNLEFYVCGTNELNPHRDIKEIGVTVYKEGQQIDGDLDELGLASLIKFLTECQDHISKFNANSKPRGE